MAETRCGTAAPPMAASTISACSRSWTSFEPVAGLALASRPTYWNGWPSSSWSRGRHERPRPHVLRLFLDPDPLAGRLVPLEHALELLGRPGIELLEPDDRHVALSCRPRPAWRSGRSRPFPSRARPGARGRGPPGRRARRENAPRSGGRPARPPACAAAGSWASSRSAACGNRGAPAASAGGNTAPASSAPRPGCCPRRRAGGTARAGRSNARAPALRNRAARA